MVTVTADEVTVWLPSVAVYTAYRPAEPAAAGVQVTGSETPLLEIEVEPMRLPEFRKYESSPGAMSAEPSATAAFKGTPKPTVPPLGWNVMLVAALALGASAKAAVAMVTTEATAAIARTARLLHALL